MANLVTLTKDNFKQTIEENNFVIWGIVTSVIKKV